MNIKNKKLYYFVYSIFFAVLSSMVLYYFYSQGRTMIDYGGDGYRQHYRALLYYSNYLKTIFSNIFIKGQFIIPQWDFSIGEGSDVLSTFHYYGIGDIFTFFCFLVPDNYLYLFYDFASVARMYFSGVAFSYLCFYKKHCNIHIVLAASLLYSFCSYNLSNMHEHVFFLSASVFLPLIVCGVEKIINNEKPNLFIISVLLSSLSNIYFFYMNVLTVVIYSLVRLFFLEKTNKDKFNILIRLSLNSLLGLLMSAVVFIPMLYALLSSSRFDTKIFYDSLYPLSYYLEMIRGLSFGGYMYYGGFSALGLISLLLLLYKKNSRTLSALFAIGTCFACVPFFGSLYNALTYPTVRWLYAVTLLANYIIVYEFEDVTLLNKNYILFIAIVIVYFTVCILIDSNNWQALMLHFLAAVTIIITTKVIRNINIQYGCFVIIAILSISFDIIYCFSPRFWNYSEKGTPITVINNMKNEEFSVIESINDDTFFRYSGNDMTTNQSIQGNISSTQYYWSIANPNVIEFRKELGLSDHNNHHYDDYDGRLSLNSLSSVKYYINKNDGIVPTGFNYYGQIKNNDIYYNEHTLPLVYAYDSYINYETWNRLNLIEKNGVLLQSALLNKDNDLLKNSEVTIDYKELPFNTKCTDDIKIEENRISVIKGGSSLELIADNDEKGEYYLVLEGFDSDTSSNIVVSYNNNSKYLFFKSRFHSAYPDKHDFMINIGSLDKIEYPVIITFPNSGVFIFSSLKLVYRPLQTQYDQLEKLKDINIGNIDISNNKLDIDLQLEKKKLLCLSIPYSKGWKAYIDDKETELMQCNIQYMGIMLDEGVHHITLKYNTPYLRLGTIVSALDVTAYFVIWFKNKKYNRISKNEKK